IIGVVTSTLTRRSHSSRRPLPGGEVRTGILLLLIFMLLEPGCMNSSRPEPDPTPGIALTLATERARTINNLRYDLSFDIPDKASARMQGHAEIPFSRSSNDHPLVLAFARGTD